MIPFRYSALFQARLTFGLLENFAAFQIKNHSGFILSLTLSEFAERVSSLQVNLRSYFDRQRPIKLPGLEEKEASASQLGLR